MPLRDDARGRRGRPLRDHDGEEEDCTSHPHNEEEVPGIVTTQAVGEEGPLGAMPAVENPFGGF